MPAILLHSFQVSRKRSSGLKTAETTALSLGYFWGFPVVSRVKMKRTGILDLEFIGMDDIDLTKRAWTIRKNLRRVYTIWWSV
jgi:hypothetical protein